jgi:uncharacterized membrane protein
MTPTSENDKETGKTSAFSRGEPRSGTGVAGPHARVSRDPALGCLVLAQLLFAVAATLLQTFRLDRFEPRSFDLAIFAQGLWNLAHGSTASSIQEASFLGVHLSPLLFALAPLARTAGPGTPLLLVFVQGLALGACAPLLYALARPAVSRGTAFAVALLALAQPAVLLLALDDFHDVTLGVPLALAFALALERGFPARKLVLVALATAFLADEVYPLVLVGGAALLVLERRRREALLLLGIGAAGFVVSNAILGGLRGGALRVESLYAHWGSLDSARAFVLSDGPWTQLLSLVLALLSPLAFLPLVRPSRLLPASVVFLLHAASARSDQRSIERHYHAPITPFVLAAAVSGLVAVERRFPGRGARAGVAVMALATAASWIGLEAPRRNAVAIVEALRAPAESPAVLAKRALVARVPAAASVLASVDLLHALVARHELYGLPGAIRGRKDWSSEPYVLPADLDGVLVDTLDDGTWSPAIDDARSSEPLVRARAERFEAIVLDRGLGVLGCAGSTILLGRGGPPLVTAVTAAVTTGTAFTPDRRAPRIVAVERDASGLVLTWARPEESEGVLPPLYVATGTDAPTSVRPFLYRLYRSRPWPEGKVLREHASALPGDSVSVGLVRFEGGALVPWGEPVSFTLPGR